jgi:hypothetical protein
MTKLTACFENDPNILVLIAAKRLFTGWGSSLSHLSPELLSTDFYKVNEYHLSFYDWLTDDFGIPIAIDLGADAPAELLDDLKFKAYFQLHIFPRILLRGATSMIPMGLEAFGDLILRRSRQGIWAISSRPSDWLDAAQLDGLRELVGPQRG